MPNNPEDLRAVVERQFWNRSMRLSPQQLRALRLMAAGAELTHCFPGGWWIEDGNTELNERIDGRVGYALLRMVLISASYASTGDKYCVYTINEWGRKRVAERINSEISTSAD